MIGGVAEILDGFESLNEAVKALEDKLLLKVPRLANFPFLLVLVVLLLLTVLLLLLLLAVLLFIFFEVCWTLGFVFLKYTFSVGWHCSP